MVHLSLVIRSFNDGVHSYLKFLINFLHLNLSSLSLILLLNELEVLFKASEQAECLGRTLF